MKILFIHQGLQSFVQKDLDILRSGHEVREVWFRGLRSVPDIWSGTKWADVTFSWFGKLHAFFAVLFSKLLANKSVVVAGGDDVACEPEIGYGMFCYWWKKWCPLFVFRYADLIIPVSHYNKNETLVYAKADPCKIKMIYHGFSENTFQRLENIEKENLVITIGSVSKETQIIKGLELFLQSALYLPESKFVLIGPDVDGSLGKLKEIAPDNVELAGGVYGEELVRLCSRAKVYVQASIHESFGCSLAEAMLCECIPVVSRTAAIPEVVGDTGVYVDDVTPQNLASKIKYALTLPDDYGKKSRQRIIDEFPLYRRRQQILEAVKTISSRDTGSRL